MPDGSFAYSKAETREKIKDGDRETLDTALKADKEVQIQLSGETRAMNERIGKVEEQVAGVKEDVAQVKLDVADVKGDVKEVKGDIREVKGIAARAEGLAQTAVDQGAEILRNFKNLKVEVEKTKSETADGVKVTRTVTRWKQTAQDFHLDKLFRWLGPVIALWILAKVGGLVFGPQFRDLIIDKLFRH